MPRNLWPIVVIYIGASVAWFVLGGTLVARTTESDMSQQAQLSTQWGSALTQFAPVVTAAVGRETVTVPLRSSRVDVGLNLEQRRKGLLWYNLYDVAFAGRYVVRNDTEAPTLTVRFALPASGGSYTDVAYRIGGRPVDLIQAVGSGAVTFALAPGQSTTIDIAYGSRGMESWVYRPSSDGSVQSLRDFSMTMTTNFSAIDFPPNTLLPVSEQPLGNGWRLRWNYATLVTASGLGMQIPYPPQPGPLAQRITMWAPVSLLFYFFVMLLITTLRKIDLHPINYFFLACAFFAFHLLFAYLVDRIPLEIAFVICAVVSMFLTISYLRLAVGLRFAAVESGLAQLVYLVLFSFALFYEGWSGLTITLGAIASLFVAMQVTGRIRWSALLEAEPST